MPPKSKWYQGDVLENIDFSKELLNAEDFIAGLVAMGIDRRRGNEMWVALYAFIGSIVGRTVSNLDFGTGSIGMIMSSGSIPQNAFLSTVTQAVLIKGFMKGTYLNAFEKAAATQVTSKMLGKKLDLFSASLK